jgi:cofilin
MLAVKLDADALTTWNNFKLSKLKDGDKNVTWTIYKFDNPREPTAVVLDTKGTGDFDEFLAALPENDSRYGIYNLKYKKGDGDREKLCLLVWAPDAAPVKARMIIASNKDTVKGQLDGVAIEFQSSKKSDVTFAEWVEKAQQQLK